MRITKNCGRSLQEEHYEFGDVIVRQGEEADAFYILISGRARAVKAQASNGEEVALGTLRPGDSFGEAALAEGGKAQRHRALQHGGGFVAAGAGDFLELLQVEPELQRHVEAMGRHRALAGIPLRVQQFRSSAGTGLARDHRKAGAGRLSQKAI